MTIHTAEIGRNPASKNTRFSLSSMEMSRLPRDGTAEPVSRDQILRRERGQVNIHVPCSADHEQDWQPDPVDPFSAICDDHTFVHTYCRESAGTGLVVKVVPVRTGAAFSGITMDYFMCASLFHTHDWYVVDTGGGYRKHRLMFCAAHFPKSSSKRPVVPGSVGSLETF